MESGFVYVFSNPGLSAFKVGMSTRPLYLRQAELLREYGTVYPFEIASRHAVDDPAAVEGLAHRILARHRAPRSELFNCSQTRCVRAIHAAALLVLDRPWWLRLWHRLTLPRPAPARRGRYYRRSSALPLVVAVLTVAVLLAQLAPVLPDWMPARVIRAASMLARLHRY